MKSSGVNLKFAKCLIIFMSLVILLEGLLYLGLSVWGIAIKNCARDVPSIQAYFEFVLHFIYFRDTKCGADFNFELPNGTVIEPQMPPVTDVAARTYTIFIVYAAISALWIVTSLMILATVCSVVNKISYAVCFWPWLISVLAGSILDVVATALHIIDIMHTTNGQDTLEYLQVENYEQILMFLQPYEPYFITPGVIFTLASSRLVIFWLMNFIGAIFTVMVAKDLMKNEKRKSIDRSSADNLGYEPPVHNRQIQRLPSTRERSPSPPPKEQQMEQTRRERRTLEPLKFSERKNSVTNSMTQSSPMEQDPPQMRQQPSAVGNKRVQELRTPSAYGVPEATSPDQQLSPSAPSELSNDSPLNNRYSKNEGFPFQHQPPHITEELRGQLPWSYFQVRGDDLQARKNLHAHSGRLGMQVDGGERRSSHEGNGAVRW